MTASRPRQSLTVDGDTGADRAVDDRTLALAVHLVRAARDPALPGLLLSAVVALGGFVLIGFGWRGVARTLGVGVQSPELVSGGIAGLALVGFGVALATLVLHRRAAAVERAVTAAIATQAVELAVAAPELRRRVRGRVRG